MKCTTVYNYVGGIDLKWVLPNSMKPGMEGRVMFEAMVR